MINYEVDVAEELLVTFRFEDPREDKCWRRVEKDTEILDECGFSLLSSLAEWEEGGTMVVEQLWSKDV